MTSPARSTLPITHTWFVGGALLLATIVLGYGLNLPATVGGNTIGTVLFATSLLVFAIGIRRSESVTARRPLGTTALILLAAWDVLRVAIEIQESIAMDALTTIGVLDPFVRFGLALIAVIQIGRTAAVPSPWRWAPAWALGAITVPVLLALVVTATPSGDDTTTALALTATSAVVRSASAVWLGVLAILLADRSSRATPGRSLSDGAGAATLSKPFGNGQ